MKTLLQLEINKIKRGWQTYLLIFLFTFAFLPNTAYLFVTVMPRAYWFNYKKTQSEQLVYKLGGPIDMLSYSIFRRTADITWSDTLRCDFDGDGSHSFVHTQTKDQLNYEPVNNLVNPGNWSFSDKYPINQFVKDKTACITVSTTTAVPSQEAGVPKTQTITSNVFFLEK